LISFGFAVFAFLVCHSERSEEPAVSRSSLMLMRRKNSLFGLAYLSVLCGQRTGDSRFLISFGMTSQKSKNNESSDDTP
jgi:hypothetical protein